MPNKLQKPNMQSYSTINIYNHKPNPYRQFPTDKASQNEIRSGMSRSPTQFWDKTKGPYGVRFEEMELHKRNEQQQYKDDLEYLMSLKNGGRHGDMTQNEW